MKMTNSTSNNLIFNLTKEGLSGISSNVTQESNESQVNIYSKALKLALYTIIFLVSAIGNILVCIIIFRKRRMKTVTNYFILNLAFADLTLTLICIPFDIPVQEMNYRWPYGSFMCGVLYPLQTMSLFASVFTLTAVSLTRYWAILHPLKRQLSTTNAKCLIAIIWLLAIVPVSPYINVLGIGETGSCDETWKNVHSRKVYTVFLFVAQYVVPLSIIAAAYVSIGRELGRKKSDTENRSLQHAKNEEAAKVTRMLVAVTILFAVCVLPTNIMWLWLDFGKADEEFPEFWELVAFCNILTFANSAANPVCYTITNANYRKEIKYLLKRWFNGREAGSIRSDHTRMLDVSKDQSFNRMTVDTSM